MSPLRSQPDGFFSDRVNTMTHRRHERRYSVLGFFLHYSTEAIMTMTYLLQDLAFGLQPILKC